MPKKSAARGAATRSQAPAQPWWLLVALVALVAAAYQPAWHGGPVWDDDAHLTPPTLADWTGLGRIWTDPSASQQYYPVVGTAFWIMNRLWGHDPLGYHLVNIVLHGLSAFLLVVILRRLSSPGALVAGVIFALHPVHVESVAWMTELKNTLSGVLYLAAAFVYFRFVRDRSRRDYVAALILFMLALGSKTVTATLPAALLVVLWWQHGTLRWREDARPLVPFFIAGVAAGLGTVWLEYAWVGARGDAFALTLVERCLLAGRAVWFYLYSLVWPANLMFMYPRWAIDQAVWWQYLPPLLAVVTLAVLWRIRQRARAPLAAALFFGGTLFPALGFFNVFPFRYSWVADHFQYLASLGPIALGAAGLALAARRWQPRLADAALAVVVAVPLGVLTWHESRQFADEATLYRTTIERNPASAFAHNNLAALLLDGPSSGWPDAERHAAEAVRLSPRDAEAQNNLGLARLRLGRPREALTAIQEGLRLRPGFAAARHNLAVALDALGRADEALRAYEAALALLPGQASLRRDFGLALARKGLVDDAIGRLTEATRLAPADPDMHVELGRVLLAAGRATEAADAFGTAAGLQPGSWDIRNNLGAALRQAGRHQEALAELSEAERLAPGEPLVQMNLGALLVAMNRPLEAAARFERALPGLDQARAAEIHFELGRIYGRLGQRDRAVAHLGEALRLNPAHAAAGDLLSRLKR